MAKTVGKIALFLCVVWSSVAHAVFTFRAVDRKGVVLKQIPAGQPFQLEVALDNYQGASQPPHIDGLDDVTTLGRQTTMEFTSGAKRTRYLYTVRIDSPGTHTLGPVTILIDGKRRTIDEITVRVTQPTQTASSSPQSLSQTQPYPLFMRFVVDKNKVVVGEKIQATLQVYCRDDDMRIQHIAQPSWQHAHISNATGPEQTVEKVDGTDYICLTWHWQVCPQQAGAFIVPAIAAEVQLPLQDEPEDHFLQQMMLMMGGRRYTNKRIYSNSVSYTVELLPECDTTVHGVGNFTHFSTQIKPAVAKAGDGMVLSLIVEGNAGDLEGVQMPQLQGVPDALKSYESKQYSQPATGTQAKKIGEYIVQGTQPGTWQIPQQEFTYFNVAAREYTTLTTQPIQVTIKPGTPRSTYQTPLAPSAQQQEQCDEKSDDDTDDIAPISRADTWYVCHERSLPWWVILILICMPLSWVLKKKFGLSLRSRGTAKKHAFAHAYKMLNQLRARNQPERLYELFIHLFTLRFESVHEVMTEDYIDQQLKKAGFNQQHVDEWHQFFAHISQYRYGGAQSAQTTDDVFGQAYMWLGLLKEKI